jgi:hypothetical protein
MNIDNLIKMANNIGEFFQAESDREVAVNRASTRSGAASRRKIIPLFSLATQFGCIMGAARRGGFARLSQGKSVGRCFET